MWVACTTTPTSLTCAAKNRKHLRKHAHWNDSSVGFCTQQPFNNIGQLPLSMCLKISEKLQFLLLIFFFFCPFVLLKFRTLIAPVKCSRGKRCCSLLMKGFQIPLDIGCPIMYDPTLHFFPAIQFLTLMSMPYRA